jgi:hypothetical protein
MNETKPQSETASIMACIEEHPVAILDWESRGHDKVGVRANKVRARQGQARESK